jgi:hypothetical protein
MLPPRRHERTDAMKTRFFALLALLILAPGAYLFAQSGDSGSPPGESEKRHPLYEFFRTKGALGALPFLKCEIVQEELALTDAQRSAIAPLAKELRDIQAKSLKDSAKLSADERRKKHEEMFVEMSGKLESILQPRQIDRVLEIMTQFSGPILLLPQTDLGKTLGLTDGQNEKIKPIIEDVKTTMAKAMAGFFPSMDTEERKRQAKELFLKQDAIFQESNAKILEILTPEQRDRLAKMQGKLIDAAKLREQMTEVMSSPAG